MICKEEGCTRSALVRGWCESHYRKARRELGELPPPPACKEDGCTARGTAGLGLCSRHRQAISGKVCTIDDCEKPEAARGWCDKHYRLWKKNGDPLVKKERVRGVCSLEDCDRPHKGLGYCSLHYERFKRYGDPLVDKAPRGTCSVDDCERPHRGLSYCAMHFEAFVGKPGRKPKPCIIDGCEDKAYGHGWCAFHWRRWHLYGDPLTPDQRPKRGPCSVTDCDQPSVAKGLCSRHYSKWRLHGDPEAPDKRLKVVPTECIHPGCSASPKGRGYCPKHYERLMAHGDPEKVLNGISAPETEVADFVRSLGVEIETGDRTLIKPLELDILVPSRNVAVEFNGLFWHAEPRKTSTYHHTKWALCRAAGVQLVQVWEDDWRDRRPVVERMLRHKILGPDRRLGARQAERVTLAKADADAFLAEYHIQGGAAGSHYRGLMHGDGLVAVAVFRSRSDGRGELTRYAASAAVTGGLSKLMKGLPYGELVTFADHCVSDGRLYEATGWRNDGELAPDYRYVVGGRREHKFGYRLKRFREDPALLWEEGLTERELADLNGLDRIWDAGKTRYAIPLTTTS